MNRPTYELPPAVVSLVLGAIAVFFGFLVSGALRNVFADYRDSPLGTYWAIGGIAFGLSAGSALLALLAWPRKKGVWACAAALLVAASFFPFTSAVGSGAYVLNGALAIAALSCAIGYLRSGQRA
jgi:hypothetical protein